MFRCLCSHMINVQYLRRIPPKSQLVKLIRHGSSTYNMASSKSKKEPMEVVKWVLLGIPVTSFGLGCWQAKRLQWKLDLIDQMSSKTNAAPKELPQDYNLLNEMEYAPVRVKGQFLHDHEILIGPRALIENNKAFSGSMVSDPKKNQGWLVVTPFKISDTNEVILINRGWIPQSMRPKEMRQASLINHEVELVGVVRLAEKRPPFMPKSNPAKGQWFYRDLEEMSRQTGAAPVWLDARGIPDPPPGWPIPNQTRVTLRNEHLSYMVTWFSLAMFTGYMWRRFFIKRLPLI